jgi:hypothetical protein
LRIKYAEFNNYGAAGYILKFTQPGSWTLLAGLSSLLEWVNEYYIRPVGWNVGCRVGYAKLTFLKFTSKAFLIHFHPPNSKSLLLLGII